MAGPALHTDGLDQSVEANGHRDLALLEIVEKPAHVSQRLLLEGVLGVVIVVAHDSLSDVGYAAESPVHGAASTFRLAPTLLSSPRTSFMMFTRCLATSNTPIA